MRRKTVLTFHHSCFTVMSSIVWHRELDDWASDEFGAADPGDARLPQRLVALSLQLSPTPKS
jgi:hypothetical protein